MKTFYVCSYGGSGSWLLVNHLKQFGKAHHVHTRKPPEQLSEVKGEHFTTKQLSDITGHYVIYIYSEPEYSMHCQQSFSGGHWRNIGVDPDLIQDRETYIKNNQDLIKYEQFFDNYHNLENKNYNILFIRFEKIWDNLDAISNHLDVSFDKFPGNKYNNKPKEFSRISVYDSFRERINKLEPVFIK